jgi:hypothetical protein
LSRIEGRSPVPIAFTGPFSIPAASAVSWNSRLSCRASTADPVCRLETAGATAPCTALVCVASAPPWILVPQLRALPFLARQMPAILAGRPIRPDEGTLRRLALHDLPEPEQYELVPTFGAESAQAFRTMLLGSARIPGRQFHGPVLCLSGSEDRVISNSPAKPPAMPERIEVPRRKISWRQSGLTCRSRSPGDRTRECAMHPQQHRDSTRVLPRKWLRDRWPAGPQARHRWVPDVKAFSPHRGSLMGISLVLRH